VVGGEEFGHGEAKGKGDLLAGAVAEGFEIVEPFTVIGAVEFEAFEPGAILGPVEFWSAATEEKLQVGGDFILRAVWRVRWWWLCGLL
jgi:hypothetical protein